MGDTGGACDSSNVLRVLGDPLWVAKDASGTHHFIIRTNNADLSQIHTFMVEIAENLVDEQPPQRTSVRPSSTRL